MAKNRKNVSAAARFGPAIVALVFCTVAAGAGLNYVYQKNQIFDLGKQISKAEIKLDELRSENRRLTKRLMEAMAPRALDAKVKELNLGLGAPRPEQILRLREDEPVVPRPAPGVTVAVRR